MTIAGGKLTGYRKMAEETVVTACQIIGVEVSQQKEDEPIPGGDIGADLDPVVLDLGKKFNVTEDRAARLVRLYGGESEQVLQLGSDPLVTNGFVVTGEVRWALEEESAQGLEDVLYRRTRAALYKPEELDALIQPTADMMAVILGWNTDRKAREITAVRRRMEIDLPS